MHKINSKFWYVLHYRILNRISCYIDYIWDEKLLLQGVPISAAS